MRPSIFSWRADNVLKSLLLPVLLDIWQYIMFTFHTLTVNFSQKCVNSSLWQLSKSLWHFLHPPIFFVHILCHWTSQISQRRGVNLWSLMRHDSSISAWWWLRVRSSVRRPRSLAKCWGSWGCCSLQTFLSTSNMGSCRRSTACWSFTYGLSVVR